MASGYTPYVDTAPRSTGGPEPEARAGEALARARRAVALTGAGISVESGIPDFRSPDGLWSVFDPEEYATLRCFLRDPGKSWRLFRALGKTLSGRHPNAAHAALARLEHAGRLAGVITQNIDRLHQAAGSRTVLEIHGDASRLRCLRCDRVEPFAPECLEDGPVPLCRACAAPLKPDVVLFEEPVRGAGEIASLLEGCDLLLLVGTSAEVWPASSIPERALDRGVDVIEFNVRETRLSDAIRSRGGTLVRGRVTETLPRVAAPALRVGSEA